MMGGTESILTRHLDFSGRVAIVTGGGSGIGAATARLLAEHGAALVVAGRTVEALERVSDEVRSTTGAQCLPVPTDMKDEASIEALVGRTLSEFEHVDVIVNSAGGGKNMAAEATPTRVWDSQYELNVRGPFLLMRALAPHMIERRRGAIVNVGSMAGEEGLRGGAAYCSAKYALQQLTAVVAAEWGRHGIRVNCVAPGFIGSERAREMWDAIGLAADEVCARVPLRRIGEPWEVATVIAFLASDAASYVTGQTLLVDGGPIMEGIDYDVSPV
jgi:citronellol/citronellal dehydrogenase